MPYNRWYTYAYDHIRQIADWSDLAADVEIKIIAIFSWMRQPIMSIKHSKDSVKHELITPDLIRATLESVSGEFDKIKTLELKDFDVHRHEKTLEELCDALFPIRRARASRAQGLDCEHDVKGCIGQIDPSPSHLQANRLAEDCRRMSPAARLHST
jgi:hypothetical protein